jgi:hypothetical protein
VGHEIEFIIFWQKWITLGLNKNLYWFLDFEMSLWGAVVFATFCAAKIKHMRKLYLLGFSAKLLGGPPCIPLVHWLNSWILFVLCSRSNMFFKLAKRQFKVRREIVKFVRGPRICFHLNCWENCKCKSSPEGHLRNPKPEEVLFWILLVTQSLKWTRFETADVNVIGLEDWHGN